MFSIYLVIGALAGMLSGLLGIGGGVVLVPAFAAIFLHFHLMPAEYAMHVAIGTSLACVIVSLLSSLRAHAKRGSVRWDWVTSLLPGIVIGTILGAVIAQQLPSTFLRAFFSLFLVIIAYRLFQPDQEERLERESKPAQWLNFLLTSIIGVLCSILGAGGGVMIIPFLMRCGLNIREASGTSAACGVMIGLSSTIAFMLLGLNLVHIPGGIGFIYLPAFLGVSIASILFAPIGTTVSYKLSPSVLKRLLAIFLVIVAIDMLIP